MASPGRRPSARSCGAARHPDPRGSSHGRRSYIACDGGGLRVIARQYGVTPASLARANGLTLRSTIVPGQRLRVPGRAAPVLKVPTRRSTPAPTLVHTVQPGVHERRRGRRTARGNLQHRRGPAGYAEPLPRHDRAPQREAVCPCERRRRHAVLARDHAEALPGRTRCTIAARVAILADPAAEPPRTSARKVFAPATPSGVSRRARWNLTRAALVAASNLPSTRFAGSPKRAEAELKAR